MSVDIVDDLHAAEDRIGYLEDRLHALLVVLEDSSPAADRPFEEARTQALVALGISNPSEQPDRWCRPSCEHDGDLWRCGDDCGCQAEHEPGGHA